MLDEIREAYANVGVNAAADPEIGSGWFGGPMTRDDAVQLARATVNIDAHERNADVEVAFLVMTS